MNIAFVTTRLFDAPRSGGEICTARLLRELSRAGHRVHVIGRGPVPAHSPDGIHHSSVGALEPAFAELPRARQWGALFAAVGTGQASTVQRLSAGGAARQVQRLLTAPRAKPLDALWLDHLQVVPWVAACAADLPAPVVVMHNLESDGYAEMARHQAGGGPLQHMRRAVLRREARLLRQLEDTALQRARTVVCLSAQDATQWRTRLAACSASPAVEVLPGFPLRVAPTAKRTPQASGRCIGLIGTWNWGPNRAGLQWMFDQVLPQLPDHCRLLLAGAGLEGWTLPARVRSLGRVDDVATFYAQVDVVAIPSLQGSGVQEKAIDAIATGRAVVATPHALRGLGPALPAIVFAAADARLFARHCAEADPGTSAALSASVLDWIDARRLQYQQALQRCHGASGAVA